VVAACSYEARRCGIHSAMPMAEAYRRAKGHSGVVFLHHGLHGNYTLYSRRIQDILRSEVPVFRAKSVDEFELDISGCERLLTDRHGGWSSLSSTCGGGCAARWGCRCRWASPSRLVAKMASRHAKPDGVYRVLPEAAERFLAPTLSRTCRASARPPRRPAGAGVHAWGSCWSCPSG